ncbi:UvrB/UvrC motif-containing protein [Burkholderia ambifaria]|uniref:UvrB/UvrC motif-containing protein n=1 Tax=Burkholderia ambifaria TaxID=152480 RepID=UPI001588FBC4|nr:UvrB/UvrC motif-containing protein [Burkholderia ambifaria]MBR8344699.1 UvrB/UvrC motif-containing protein [Burkholderia ambifaria]
MSMTKGRIERTGSIVFHDSKLAVWEEGIPSEWSAARVWERQFKRDVFARIVQALNRLGWVCIVPPKLVERHGKRFAEDYRYCRKADLQAELSLSGRCIDFEMWQDVQNGDNPNGGKYDFDKERRMTYMQRLEMERTRRRIRDYLLNVFTGYEFQPAKEPKRGPNGVTALEWIDAHYKASWHYKPALGRPDGDESSYNNRSADGGIVRHGARVWFADRKGRVVTGVAHYNINNMWWVVTGKYDLHNECSSSLYTRRPENIRMRRNADLRRTRLERELSRAVEAMNFERAAILRDIAFPGNPALFNVWHTEHQVYHCSNFRGYTADRNKAGKFSADEVRGWNCAPNKVIQITQVAETA